jgi:hypothetical protein
MTIRSATLHELHFRVEILRLEVAYRDTDAREGEEKVHPAFSAELGGEARAQPADFIKLRGEEKACLLVEGQAREAAAEENLVTVVDGQAVLHEWLLDARG